jgi:DNA polymerase-3 subunit epsilon/CBS domain-containing protein
MTQLRAVPLLAVDAVSVDLETTGLDTRTARIVQVGAVPLRRNSVDKGSSLSFLVNPEIEIPPGATAVHGIGDNDVADAVRAPEAIRRIVDFAGSRLWIGHSIGFDLAILKAEAARTGASFVRPPTLDTRLLGEIANPSLPDFSLETLCGWLGMDMGSRHDALADAEMTAQLFINLVPHLRARNIRTLAEAEAACRSMTEAMESHHGAGWEAPVADVQRSDAERMLARIDSYPYRHRIRQTMSPDPMMIDPGATILDAVQAMTEARISSLFLADEGEGYGIVTERDVMRAVAADGAAALGHEIGTIAARPLVTVPADAFVYRAVGRMDRLKIRHLGVVDETGELVGALSARDLLRLRASEAISLGDAIDVAASPAELAAVWASLPAVARSLVEEEVDPRDIAGVISRELGAATRRAAQLAEATMLEEGRGPPPQPYAFLILGSGGRGESLLAMDQDNAVIFAEGEPGGEADAWFARLGELVADTLHVIGVPYCKGGVMARNPQWRGSVETWRKRVESWVRQSRPEDLMSVDIFFDLRAVHGDVRLANDLMEDAYRLGSEATEFAKLLAAANAGFTSPLGLFGRFRTEDGRVDLKMGGLFPIVSAARVLAIRHNVVRRATPDRIEGLRALGIGGDADLDRLSEAHRVIVRRILAQQVVDMEAGIPPSNKVEIRRLSRSGLIELRDTISGLSGIDDLVRSLMFRT